VLLLMQFSPQFPHFMCACRLLDWKSCTYKSTFKCLKHASSRPFILHVCQLSKQTMELSFLFGPSYWNLNDPDNMAVNSDSTWVIH
jgi:hypothetical protein